MRFRIRSWLVRTLEHLTLFFVLPLGYGVLGPLVGWVLSIFLTAGFSLLAFFVAIPFAYKLGVRPAMLVGLIHVILMVLAVPKVWRLLLVVGAGGVVTAAEWFFFFSYPSPTGSSLSALWFGMLFGAVSAAVCFYFLESLLEYPETPAPKVISGTN